MEVKEILQEGIVVDSYEVQAEVTDSYKEGIEIVDSYECETIAE